MKLEVFLAERGWKPLNKDVETLYQAEGNGFNPAPLDTYKASGVVYVKDNMTVAYFCDSDRAIHEYVFGSGAEHFVKDLGDWCETQSDEEEDDET